MDADDAGVKAHKTKKHTEKAIAAKKEVNAQKADENKIKKAVKEEKEEQDKKEKEDKEDKEKKEKKDKEEMKK